MRKFNHHAFKLATGMCAALACGVLVMIALAITMRGLPAVSWQFYTEQIKLVGADGGIFYNLIGTFILIGTALAVSAPIMQLRCAVCRPRLMRMSDRSSSADACPPASVFACR